MHLRSDSIAWNAVGDNVVVLDVSSSTYFSTNATGTLLWQLLASGTNRADLVNALIERFAVDQLTAEQDVDAFLADLRTRPAPDDRGLRPTGWTKVAPGPSFRPTSHPTCHGHSRPVPNGPSRRPLPDERA